MTKNTMLNTSVTPVSVNEGGTGKSSFTAYSVLATGTTTGGVFQNVASLGTAGQFLQNQGGGGSGAVSVANATNRAGGNGPPGIIIVYEYY